MAQFGQVLETVQEFIAEDDFMEIGAPIGARFSAVRQHHLDRWGRDADECPRALDDLAERPVPLESFVHRLAPWGGRWLVDDLQPVIGPIGWRWVLFKNPFQCSGGLSMLVLTEPGALVW